MNEESFPINTSSLEKSDEGVENSYEDFENDILT